MLEKDNNNSKSVVKEIWSILRWMIPSPLVSGIQFVPFFSKLLERLSTYSKIPLPMLRWSLVLISFVILSLVYTSICLYKNRELKLPNKKKTGQLLYYLANIKYPFFSEKEYSKLTGIKEFVIRLYLKTLIAFDFIIDEGYVEFLVNHERCKKYTVTISGIKYLIKHKFIK